MAMTAVYTNFCGMIVHQSRNTLERDIIPDPLGSVAHLIDEDQVITASYTYTPYGEVESHSGEDTPLNFVGTLGYYRDTLLSKLSYIRARWYKAAYGRWITVDPLWPGEKAYGYVDQSPQIFSDISGERPCDCGSPGDRTGRVFISCNCNKASIGILPENGNIIINPVCGRWIDADAILIGPIPRTIKVHGQTCVIVVCAAGQVFIEACDCSPIAHLRNKCQPVEVDFRDEFCKDAKPGEPCRGLPACGNFEVVVPPRVGPLPKPFPGKGRKVAF